MLGFEVSEAASNKEIHALILRDIYDVSDIEFGKLYFTIICSILN